MSAVGRIHSVETFGAVDGPGIRYILFVQGCPMRCLYCHNPDSWKTSGGTEITAEKAAEDVEKYLDYIKSGGFTISGGEPLLQPLFTAEVLMRVKKLGLHTAIDTSGAVPLETAAECLDSADLVLLDIKTADPEQHIALTGQNSDMTLAALDYCEKTEKPVFIRHVLVPEITLDESRLTLLGELLKDYRCVKKIELLPFHKMGEFKWKNLGLDYKLEKTQPPTSVEMKKARLLIARICPKIPVS